MRMMKATTGDCECCSRVNVAVVMRRNYTICDECIAKEDAVAPTMKDAQVIIDAAREIDNNIRVQSDVYNAKTVAAVELKGAIDNDDTIPADQKDYRMAQVCKERMTSVQKAIFDKKQEIKVLETEAKMWQTEAQNFAGKLRAELREQFKNLDIQYNPQPVKPTKQVTKSTAGKVTAKASDIKAAADKYKVPANLVAMICNARKMGAEDAAKLLSSQMN